MRTTVDQLLSLSRLPFHFWTDLNGGRPHWDNPGSSILSYALTKVSHEIIDVPEALQSTLQECTDFTTKSSSIMHLFTWLGAVTTKIVSEVAQIPDAHKMAMFGLVNELMKQWASCRTFYETIAGSSGVLPDPFDNTSQLGKMFMQAVIETKLQVNALRDAMSKALDTPPPKELA